MLTPQQIASAREQYIKDAELAQERKFNDDLVWKMLSHIYEQLSCMQGLDMETLVEWAPESVWNRCVYRSEYYASCDGIEDEERYIWGLVNGIAKGLVAKKAKQRLYGDGGVYL